MYLQVQKTCRYLSFSLQLVNGIHDVFGGGFLVFSLVILVESRASTLNIFPSFPSSCLREMMTLQAGSRWRQESRIFLM
jgi:hypothetical protein